MKKILKIAFLIILTSSCSTDNGISNSEVTEIGNLLAQWSDGKCTLIEINDQEILFQGPNPGGCSPIYFTYTGNSFEAPFEELENKVQMNLRNVLENSSCDVQNLLNQLRNITRETTKDELSDILNCTGNVEYVPGTTGVE